MVNIVGEKTIDFLLGFLHPDPLSESEQDDVENVFSAYIC